MTEGVIRKATHGMKEADASQISVLNDLFCTMQRKRVKDLGMTEEQESRYVGRLARSIESTGAPDKVALGEVLGVGSKGLPIEMFSRMFRALSKPQQARQYVRKVRKGH